MAYVKRIPIKTSLKNSLKYILNPSKNEEGLLVSGSNCPINGSLAYKIMEKTKEEYNKKDKIQGIHFIQSFRPEENITPQTAHEVGRKWADKFLNSYEYLLSTHKDKGHIHNHIIINSVSFETGKKYLKNDRELREIRKLSDEVCREYGLDIIEPKKENRNKSYKEWKSHKENISWKDKIKIDINETIEESKTYEDFLEKMKSRGYELKYGNSKYNTFKHKEMGRSIRGKTLGEDYTEKKIKDRIEEFKRSKLIYLSKYREDKNLCFNEDKFYKESFSNKEIIRGDIDLTIQEVGSYEEFIEEMKLKGYELKFGNVKYNSFRHRDMKKACRGMTIGEEYTEEAIKDRIEVLVRLRESFRKKDSISISRNTYFDKRYLNNKFKYMKENTTRNTNRTQEEKETIDAYFSSLRSLKLENKVYDLLDKYSIKSKEDLGNKLRLISSAVGSKKSEYNDRLELIQTYKLVYKQYKETGILPDNFKDIEDFEERFIYQKELLDENLRDFESYKKVEKDLRTIAYKLKDRELDR